MKLKREIIIISLIIAVLFTISSVCAVDSEIQAISTHNSTDELMSTVNDDSLEINNDVEILGETDGGTYSDLSSKISGATENSIIFLENDYDYSTGSPTSITINVNNLTIDGKGHSIDAKQKCRIFASTTKLTLRNITFLNAYSASGAVFCQSPDLLIDNCTFIDNTGTQYWGGAICVWSNSKATIVNSTFKGNINHGGYGMGGAIGVNGYALIENCTFENNKGTYYGGGGVGVYSSGSADISNSTFIDNHATDDTGGAIEVYGTANIDRCVFLDNTASVTYGNAICLNGKGKVTNSIFINNPNGVIYSYNSGGPTASHNWFGNTIDNYETPLAVVKFVEMNDYHVLNLDLNNDDGIATVSLNNLYKNGVLDKSNTDYNLPPITVNVKGTNVDLDENVTLDKTGKATIAFTPTTEGYSITVSYKNIKLTKEMKPSFTYLNSLINNLQTQTLDLEDDFEYCPNSDSALSGGILLDENIIIDGHGHYIDAKGQSCIFKFNDDSKNLVLRNISFYNAKDGAAVYFKGNKIEIINCTFEGNDAASENGNSVYVESIGEASKIDQCSFINNKGVVPEIYINSEDIQFNVINSIFLNNSGLNIKANGNVIAQHNWFGHNASNYEDDAIAKVEGVSLNNCLYLNISSEDDVATISLNNVNGHIYDGYLLPTITLNVKGNKLTPANNYVFIGETGVGKVNYVLDDFSASLTVNYDEDSTYTKEIEFVDDGSFTALQYLIKLSTENTINLEKNYTYNPVKDSALLSGITITKSMTINGIGNVVLDAKDQARIFKISQDITFNNITFANGNSASADNYNRAGAIYCTGGTSTFIKCNFINNTATNGAGVMYVYSSTVTSNFEDCTFSNNHALNSYGGVLFSNVNVNFKNSIFTNNSALGGGVYYSEGGGSDSYDNCTFINNSATYGAVIRSNYQSTGKIINSKFIGNKVIGGTNSETNAIIYSRAPNIEGCIFINNTGSSSIIYFISTNAKTVKNSIFLNNSAQYIINDVNPQYVTADYNWFGNNDTTYDTKPNVAEGVVLNNWYALNITATKNKVIISINNLFDGTNVVHNYADYALPDINLDIKSANIDVQNNVTITQSGKSEISYTINDETGLLSVAKNNDVIMTKEIRLGDFDLLQKLVNEKGVVELTRNYTYDLIFDDMTEGIIINKPNLIINGNGFVIDAKGKSRIFKITESGVIINNVTLINAKADDGAAIRWEGDDGTIKSSTILNNTATSAIYWTGSSGDINNCILLNNSGKNIISTQSDLTVDDNWFGNNASNYNINIANVEGISLNKWYFLNITLFSHKANLNLNNLYVVATSENVTNDNYALPNVNFTLTGVNITTLKNAIIAQKGNIDVSLYPVYKDISLTASYENASFTKNATLAGDFNLLQELIDSFGPNSKIELNRDYTYILGADTIVAGITITEKNLTIDGNGHTIDAKGQSRIFDISSEAYNLTIDNVSFVNGKHDTKGGAIYGEATNLNVVNCRFENNSAGSQPAGSRYAGAIYFNNAYGNIANCTFIKNTAPYGAAIYINDHNVTIFNSTFIENTGPNGYNAQHGGAILISGSNVSIDKCIFIKNKAYYGSAIKVNANNGNVSNSVFLDNEDGDIIKLEDGKSIVADYNWWGNTYNNAHNNPQGVGVTLSNWLFLYATSNGKSMIVGEEMDVEFIFELYKSSSSSMIQYDTSKVHDVELTLTAVNGELNKQSATTGETIGFTALEKAPASLTGTINDVSYTFNLNVKSPIYINTVDEVTVYVDNSTEFEVTVDPDIGGVIWFDDLKDSIAEATYNAPIINGISEGTSVVIVKYNIPSQYQNDYEAKDAKIIVHVIKYNTDLAVNQDSITVNWGAGSQDSGVILIDEIGRNFNLDDEDFSSDNPNTAHVENNKIIFGAAGTANITVQFKGNNSHNPSGKAYIKVTVNPSDSSVIFSDVEFDYGSSNTTSLTLTGCTVDLENITVIDSDNNPITGCVRFDNGIINVSNLDVGLYTLKVTTTPDENHTSVTETANVLVNPAGSDVVVPASTVVYGSSVTVVVDLVNASGVTASLFKGTDKVKDLVVNDDVNVVVDAVGVDVGDYILKVTTVTDGNHASVTKDCSIAVNPAGSDVVVPVSSSVVYGSSVTVVASGLVNASGVTASLFKGTDKVKDLVVNDDVNVVVDAVGVDVGDYTLKVTTVTDSNHASVTKECSIAVNPAGSDVTVQASESVDYKGSVDIVASGLVNASGITAKLYLGTVEMSNAVSVNDLTVTVDASDLNVGDYTLKITTVTDDNHSPITRECIVTVNQIDSEVTFLPNKIHFAYEDEGSTIATCIGCTIEQVNVAIENHPEAVIKVEGNKITVSNLTEDEYTMKVITTPINSNYKSIETSIKVNVSGISPKMSMQVSNITVGEKEIVFITMGTDAKGIVNITIYQGNRIIESRNITINNIFNKTEFVGLNVGDYLITAHYYGTQNYNEATVPDQFKVHPTYDYEFTAFVNDTVCGNTTNLTVKLSSDATGSIKVGNIIEPVGGAETVIELPVQNKAGKNNVTVKYIPDENSKYCEKEIIVYYNVAKKSTQITIDDIIDAKAGDDVTISANAYPNAEIVLYLDGAKLNSNIVENISAGTHTIIANVAETNEYLSATANKTFTVTKTDVVLSVSGTPAKVNEKSTITVGITDGVTGTVIVNVDGVDYVLNASDIAPFDIVFDRAGSYDLSARYFGDYKYNSKEVVGDDIEITDKADANIVVSDLPTDIKAGDTFNVTITANSPLKVYVDGVLQTLDVENKLTVSNVAAGIHNITVVADETSDVYADEKVIPFEAVKKVATISIDDITAKAGDDVNIVASAYDGADIVVYVDGVKTKNVENISAGTHTIIASVAETNEYLSATANKTFTVTKTDVVLSVSGTPAKVNEKSTITVGITDGVTGTVIVNVDGVDYVLNASDIAPFDIVFDRAGSYDLSARYFGDYKYNSKEVVGDDIEITDKADANIVVSDLPTDIKAGDTFNVTITANSPLKVYVDGVLQTLDVENKLTVSNVAAGIHNITVVADETSDVYADEKVIPFEAVKKVATISIDDIIDAKAGDDVNIVASAYDGADIVVYVDGVKTKNVENISAGTHTIIASVAETNEYLSATANKTFEVTKSDIKTFIVFAHPDSVTVGEKALIHIRIMDNDVSGAAIVNVNGTEYSVNITGDDEILEVVMNRIGEITLSARYLGNYKYNAKDAEGSRLTVTDKETTEITIQSDSLVVVGQEMTINVTDLPNLIVTINGNVQTVNAGKIIYTPSTDGAYTIIARTGENATHHAGEAIASFTVINKTKETPTIEISKISDAKVGKEFNFTVTAIGGGDAVVKINNVTIPITDGVYKYTPQKSGTFTLTVETPENDKYSKGVNITAFDADKNEVDLKVSADSVLVGESATVKVDIAGDASGIVIIIVNGTEYTMNISKGEKSLKVVMPEVGNATLSAKYLGDYKYNTKDVEASPIEVRDKADSIIEINDPGLNVGKPTNPLTAKVNGVVCDDIVFTINGVEGISINKVEAITYTIVATFKGNATHKANTTSKVYKVDKKQSELSIIPPLEIIIGEPAVFEINSGDRTDAVVYIDGEEYEVIHNTVEFTNPAAGTHTIIAGLKETDEYLSAAANFTFNVDKKDSSIEISTSSAAAKLGETVTVYINPTGADGIVLLNVNGTIYPLTAKDNHLDIVLDSVGTYTINATYMGDDIFKSSSSNVETVEVTEKQVSNIVIQIPEVNLVGEDIVINITSDVTPLVYVDGEKQNYKDGKVTVSDLKAGNHTIEVITPETGDYKANSTVKSFNVDKKDSAVEISVSANEAYIGSELTITVSPTSGAAGNVLVNVDGTVYSLTLPDNEVKVVLDKIATYTINATYAGSDIYKQSSSKAVTVEVKDKTAPIVDVQIPDVNVVGEDIVINITSDADPEVYVDGEKQTYKDGKVVVSGLGAGSHVVEVITPETATAKASSVAKSLTVSKKQSSIEIIGIQGDKLVGSDLKVILKYEGNSVAVYLDGVELAGWDSFTAAAGNHTITAGIIEDEEYLSSTANATFEILKNNVDIDVSGTHTTLGEKSTVTVEIDKDATGIVVVNVDGTEYSLNISKTSSFDVVFNEPGEYEITATYLGDDRYGSAKATGTIAVYDKKYADIELIIPSETIYAGDDVAVFVEYVGDANLTATVDGVLVEIDEGQFTIENIGAGSHTIEVTSPETKQYHEFKAIETFEAVKYSSEITINVPQNIKAGQNVEVEITSYDGADITVTLDGAKQTLTDGKVKFTASAGDHTIVASVDETDMYLANYTEASFTVSKLDAAIKVAGTDITQGQATTITVTADVDEGVVVVKLNGSEVAVDLAKSKSASVVLDTPGVYELSASYLGTDIYNAAEAEKSTINVAEKVTPEVEVDIPEIHAGESETISVSIPNATGSVYVIVDGVQQVIPLDENGNANYTIPEMGAGNHSVVVLYPGDGNNEAKVVSQSVFVPKQSSKADISTPTDVKEGENATVGVDIPGAKGSVSVIIDGKETVVPLDENGKANYTIPEMGAGNHSVVVIYPGDDTNDATYSTATFTVEGEVIIPKLSTEFTNINLTGDLAIHAVLKDFEGNPVADALINYTVGSKAGTVRTGSDGSLTVQGNANTDVTLVFAGDDRLEPTNITIKIDDITPVIRLGSQLNVTEGASIKTYTVDTPAGEVGALAKFRLTDSNGDPIVNATIKFAYKTVILNRTTDEDGIVFIGINTQVAQEALCALSYVGDDKYNATFVAFSFDIQKKPITISAPSKSYKSSEKTKKYTVTLKTKKCNSNDGKVYLSSGKKVTLKINGKTYTGKTDANGQVTFKIKISKKGKYSATVKFAGDKTYASASKSVKITIK